MRIPRPSMLPLAADNRPADNNAPFEKRALLEVMMYTGATRPQTPGNDFR